MCAFQGKNRIAVVIEIVRLPVIADMAAGAFRDSHSFTGGGSHQLHKLSPVNILVAVPAIESREGETIDFQHRGGGFCILGSSPVANKAGKRQVSAG